MNHDSLYRQILAKIEELHGDIDRVAEVRADVERLRANTTSAHQRIDDLEKTVREALATALSAQTAPAKKRWYQESPWNRLIYVGVLVGILILSQFKLIDLVALDTWWDRATNVGVRVMPAIP